MTMRQAGLGAKLKAARLAKGLKQKHVAAAVHVEPVTVSRWERGATTPDLDMLERVAEILGQPLSHFVSDARAASTERDEVLARLDQLDTSFREMAALLRSLVSGRQPPSQDPPDEQPAAQDQPG